MDRKRLGMKLDAHSKKELLELLKSHVKQEHMPKSLHELLRKWTDGSEDHTEVQPEDTTAEAVEDEQDLEDADT